MPGRPLAPKTQMRRILVSLSLLCAVSLLGLTQLRHPAPSRLPASHPRKLRVVSTVPVSSGTPVFDSVRIFNASPDAVDQKPYTLSHFFAAGEIPHFASVRVEGADVPTQCDVKTRWPDGSLQHAILTFQNTVPAQGSTEVTFADTESPLPPEGLDIDAMLSADPAFGARMEVRPAGGEPVSVDAREMIRQGKFRYWLKGPLVTQVIVEDASEDPAFDVPFNGFKSFHPIFVLTFYPGHPGVRVEFIGENAWIDRLQDIRYSLALFTSNQDSAKPVYQHDEFTHIPNTRWRKIFWSGAPLPSLYADHNLPYLIYSRAIPNFDLSRTLPPQAVDQELNALQRAHDDDLTGSCLFQKYMPSTGGRPELGVFNGWDVRYLYTFDPRLREVVDACAETSGHIPIHFRESRPGRAFSSVGDPSSGETAPAVGRVVSTDARPDFCSRDWGLAFSSATDRPVLVGPATRGGWTPDTAHQPSFAYLPYLLTGDWYYLEELYFWSAWNLASGTPGDCFYCRGKSAAPDPVSYSIIHTQENQRGVGWALRTLFHTVLLAPDGSPEKTYFMDKMLNNLAAHEGRFNITGGLLAAAPERTPVWEFGRNLLEQGAPNPLNFWCVRLNGSVSPTDSIVDPAKTFSTTSPWMTYIVLDSLAIGAELGFPASPFHQALGRYLVGQLTSPEFNPYLVNAYYAPSNPARGVPYQSWAEVLAAFRPSYIALNSFRTPSGAEFDYGFIALSALSSLTSLEIDGQTGMSAYQWMRNHYPSQELLTFDPKWAIVPRDQPVPGSVSAPDSWSSRFKSPARSAARKTPSARRHLGARR